MSEKPRKRRPKPSGDFSTIAFQVVQAAADEESEPYQPDRDSHAVTAGHLGGLKGGKARADKLTPEQRSEIAKKAAAKRWEETREPSRP